MSGCVDKCVDGWVVGGCVADGCTDVYMGGWLGGAERRQGWEVEDELTFAKHLLDLIASRVFTCLIL